MLNIEKPRNALREEGCSAWLLANVFHRDEVADLILDVPRQATNTRPWICVVFPDRMPVKIVHRIEASILDHVPGDLIPYATRDELSSALSRVLPRAGVVAADFSPTIPVGSFLDHGTALLVEGFGCRLVPAENLVARCLGTSDEQGMRAHTAAAKILFSAVHDAWAMVKERMAAGAGRRALHEEELRDLIHSRLRGAGLESDSVPMVGFAEHTSDPHYAIHGAGAALRPGDVVQFDLWAKEPGPGAVYADISWVGVAAVEPSPAQKKAFEAVVRAREEAIGVLVRGLEQGKGARGADVDAAARAALVSQGYGEFLRHRTGHSIGGRVHGFGVNLDSVEFPDNRVIPDGACFSVEPGVYLPEFGMRTEIDCWIHGGKLEITGGERQRSLLLLE